MKKNERGQINNDITNVEYYVGLFKVSYEIVNSCKTDTLYISGKIIFSNYANSTCIDYIDFNNAFGSLGITRDEPWEINFDSKNLISPFIYSKQGQTWEGPTAQIRNMYIYPNYKTSKSCIDNIITKFGHVYR